MSEHDNLFASLRDILVTHFEIPADQVTPEADIYSDLELDSIDAVDLVIHVQELIGKKINPKEFKSARTVSDVIGIVVQLAAG